MWMRKVPECFTNIAQLSLTGHTTKLKFNNFISEPFPLTNGTMQGNPSMNYYSFYNTLLIKTASSVDKLFMGFVDN